MRCMQLIPALCNNPTCGCLSLEREKSVIQDGFFFPCTSASSTRRDTPRHFRRISSSAQACRRTRGVESIVGPLASTKRACRDNKARPCAQYLSRDRLIRMLTDKVADFPALGYRSKDAAHTRCACVRSNCASNKGRTNWEVIAKSHAERYTRGVWIFCGLTSL